MLVEGRGKSSMSLKARIVILNYNGEEMLAQCLPSITDAVRRAKTPTMVTVLDNGSSDGSHEYVQMHFPKIEFVKAPENLVLCSYNAYLGKISEPIAILLNNDIKVDPGFIDPLMEKFIADPATFLVAPRVMNFDGSTIDAVDTRAEIRCGMFYANARYPGYEAHTMVPSKTFASGFGAFSLEKFLSLGGYDLRYLPGIMEDADLCLRAGKAGYSLYYDPRSVVYHMGQASFKKAFTDLRRSTLAYRNTFLFMWKNLTGIRFWIGHLLWLPIRIIANILRGRIGFALGLIEALSRNISNTRCLTSGPRDLTQGVKSGPLS